MKVLNPQSLTVDACREALVKFWGDQLQVETSKDGLLVALPSMYPDGLQVVVGVTPISPAHAILSDRGESLIGLGNAGVDLDLPRNAETLQEKIKVFELQRQGFELQKPVRLPLDGMDIHLFGEALVSISHLIYRHELSSPKAQHVYTGIRDLLTRKHLAFREGEDAYVPGKLEGRIRVDFLVTEKRQVACKAIERRGRVRDYVEQWGFRWLDVHDKNPRLVRAMFYDPDNQQWDDESLRIGKAVCEIFQPYFETDRIGEELARYKQAA